MKENEINEIGLQDFVNYKKPVFLDASFDRPTKLDLDKLVDVSKDVFAEDKRQMDTTPLIQMSTDTGYHPPIAKKPYTLALKHYDWVKEEIYKLLEAGVIRESNSRWSAPIVVVPKGDGDNRLCADFRALIP